MEKINPNLRTKIIALSLFKSCRPKQWTKNILIFAVILFSFIFNKLVFINCLLGFISFCFISSAIYLFNDIKDISKDRLHPQKKFRPIPNGNLPIRIAIKSSIFLAFIGFILGYLISFKFLIIIIIYVTIQIAYCLRLKKEPILDVLCIASGFMLRALSGVVASEIGFSPWFILTIGLLALFLAVEKRKAELNFYIKESVLTREILDKYTLPLLERYENLLATSTFISYSLWAAGPSLNGAQSSWMLLSLPFVLIGIFRYQFISDNQISIIRKANGKYISTENPELILLHDKGIRFSIIGWLITIIFVGIFLRF